MAATQKVSGEVTTAIPLDAATLQRAAELSRVTGESVQLFQKVDPAYLGDHYRLASRSSTGVFAASSIRLGNG